MYSKLEYCKNLKIWRKGRDQRLRFFSNIVYKLTLLDPKQFFLILKRESNGNSMGLGEYLLPNLLVN
jgi:hypothetical protein